MKNIYRSYDITREKIDSQIRWVVSKDGTVLYTTADGEDDAMNWVDKFLRATKL